jgi:hypothetical protein
MRVIELHLGWQSHEGLNPRTARVADAQAGNQRRRQSGLNELPSG